MPQGIYFSSFQTRYDINLVNEKMDQVFEKLDCAAKINFAMGFA